ncbi:MAG: outer membrane protein assembly factor BamC [Pseudomonadota bacterium]|jgi:outer membrane protein assembly factor BamC
MSSVVRGARIALMGAMLAFLSACAVTEWAEEKGKIDYRSATTRQALDVPPDLVTPRADPRFRIPDTPKDRTLSGFEQRGRVATGPATAASQANVILPRIEGLRIEREGARRWLVVDAAPETLWSAVREFWVDNGFRMATERPEAGILETDWAENRAKIPLDLIRRTLGRVFDNLYSTGERDRFRTRFERTSAGTEIHISHRGMIEVYASAQQDSTVWQPRPSDPELEAEFLNRLMLRLGGRDARPSASATDAARPGVTPQTATAAAARPALVSRLAGEGAQRRIELDQPFDRAWRTVALALDRGSFTIEDRDRSAGVFFVRYIDADEQARAAANSAGVFSRLFGGGRAALSQQFRFLLTAAGSITRIVVLDKEGQPVRDADLTTVQRMLELLNQELSR